jgi:acid stress chaperone HdeB
MIKLISASLLAALALTLAPVAEARKGQIQDIDFGAISCKAFLNDLSTASEEDAGAIFLWLDGYLSGVSGDTVLRWDGMGSFAEELVNRCQRRGNERLLDAARNVGLN